MLDPSRLHALQVLLDQLAEAHVAAALCLDQIRQELTLLDGHTDTGMPRVRLDPGTFCVLWDRRRCELGHTLTFALLDRLVRTPNLYLTCEQLLRDVWHGDRKSPHTVRSTIRHLRAKLAHAGMPELATAIRSRQGAYGLLLPPPK